MSSVKATTKTDSSKADKETGSKKIKVESKTKKVEKEDKIKETKVKETKVKKDAETVVEPEIEKSNIDLKFQTQFKSVIDLLKHFKEQYQTLSIEVKKLETSYNHDLKKVKKHKQKRNGNYKPTGFTKAQSVPNKLAKFIGVELGTELTGPQITKKVWEQLKLKNLFYAKDKRVFRTNDEVSDIFGVPATVNKSISHKDVDNGFNFCNLQKYISNALKA